MTQHLTEKEVAKRLKVTTRTLQNWRRAGHAPKAIKLGERTVRYRLEDVEAYENSRRAA